MTGYQVVMLNREWFMSNGESKDSRCWHHNIYLTKKEAEEAAEILRDAEGLEGTWRNQVRIWDIPLPDMKESKHSHKLSDYAIVRRAFLIAKDIKETAVFVDMRSAMRIFKLRIIMRNSMEHLHKHPNSIVGDMINGYTMYGDIWFRWHHDMSEVHDQCHCHEEGHECTCGKDK